MPQLVFQMENPTYTCCAHAPATRCVVVETSLDDKRIMVKEFDPAKGRGNTLRIIEKNKLTARHGTVTGRNVYAISESAATKTHIHLISLAAGPDHEIAVKGWPDPSGLNWSPTGKGLYSGFLSRHNSALLYVDLKGDSQVLWQYKANPEFAAGVLHWTAAILRSQG